jgi:site-specific DNA-methyltransferase (adenine-specific)
LAWCGIINLLLNLYEMIDLRLGDCLEIMKSIPDKSIDLVLTDPPYNFEAQGGGIQKGRKYEGDWDVRPTKEYFDEMLRISKQAIIFGGQCFTDLLPQNNHWIVWDKTGQIKFDNPYSGAELAWTNISKNTVKKYVCIQAGFISQEKDRWHPTQKPVAVMRAILRDYDCKSIIDPFMGSGTTGVACKELGRNFIGIEISPEYFKIAERRINQTMENLL